MDKHKVMGVMTVKAAQTLARRLVPVNLTFYSIGD